MRTYPYIDTEINIEDYHKREGISASRLKKALKSSAHFFTKDKPSEQKEHFNIGHAFEDMFAEGGLPENTYWVFDPEKRPLPENNMNKTLNKEWKAEQYKMNEGKKVLTAENMEDLKGMLNSCEAKHIQSVLKGEVIKQLSAYWIDEESGLLCKTRPDIVIKRKEGGIILVDIKTANDSSPNGFAKQFSNLNYGIQAATQIDGIETAMNDEVLYYIYLVVEKTAPYNASLFTLPFEDIEKHQAIYKDLLMKVKRAKENPKYIEMGYAEDCGNKSGIMELEVPSWNYKQ